MTRLAPFDIRRDAAICQQVGKKRTRHQRAEPVESDADESGAGADRAAQRSSPAPAVVLDRRGYVDRVFDPLTHREQGISGNAG